MCFIRLFHQVDQYLKFFRTWLIQIFVLVSEQKWPKRTKTLISRQRQKVINLVNKILILIGKLDWLQNYLQIVSEKCEVHLNGELSYQIQVCPFVEIYLIPILQKVKGSHFFHRLTQNMTRDLNPGFWTKYVDNMYCLG